jgi:2'-5' RNA ligase
LTADARQQRIFFALWPDAVTRERLAGIAAQIALRRPARRVPDYNLHLTLHFIGTVDSSVVDCMRRQARAVESAAFEIVIDASGRFTGAGVGWLGCSQVADDLGRLHRRLGRELTRCDYLPEKRAYRPHVTVARKLGGALQPIAFDAVRWKVDNFVLLESRPAERGVRYHVVETYPLA